MTANRLIALLECYRTGRPEKSGLGTLSGDIKYLLRQKLIESVKGRYLVTEEGRTLVVDLLLIAENNLISELREILFGDAE